MKRCKPQDDWDLMAELKIGVFLNKSFENVLDFDRILIKSSFSFPAGESLLVIERRSQE